MTKSSARFKDEDSQLLSKLHRQAEDHAGRRTSSGPPRFKGEIDRYVFPGRAKARDFLRYALDVFTVTLLDEPGRLPIVVVTDRETDFPSRPKSKRKPKARAKSAPRAKPRSKAVPWPKGAMHRALGVPHGKKIPLARLKAAAKGRGEIARRAQTLLNLRGHRTGRRK